MLPPKDYNNLPVEEQKAMEIYNLPNKDIKIAILRKLNELHRNKYRQSTKIRKTIQ